jgi:hypothetical protein
MHDVELRVDAEEEREEAPQTGDRLSASVQHALRLVGPAEGGAGAS